MAPLPPDPYHILGVPKDAQTPEIRSSYRKLVLKCHPDKVQDPQLKEEKQNEFQRVQQAYELLTNDAERQKYDDKVRLEDLRRQMKEKAHISSPKPSAKYSDFEIRTPDMRSPAFKSSPSAAKVYTFGRFDEEYVTRGTRIFETKSNRSAKREPSFSERQSKRDSEKEREKDKERRRKEEKEAQKLEKRRQEKQRDREIKRDHEEKYRSRNAKPSVEVFEDELPKSERKRSTKKHDDKAGRTSPRDDKPTSSSRPPISNTFYSPTDRTTYESASSYVQASRGPPSLNRSHSYTTRPAYPAAPSPPPSNGKKTYLVEDSDSDDYVRRSSAPARRGSGDGPRLSRERSYRQASHEVLEDTLHAASSAAARHTASFSRSVPMGSSPPRHDMQLPRTNSMPQPSFTRPGPGMTRSHTYAAPEMPHGRDRSRNHPQAHIEISESDDEFERERRHRSSRRTTSPEPHPPSVFRYEVDSGTRRSHRTQPPLDVDGGHGHYMYAQQQPVRGPDTRGAAAYREPMHAPPGVRYPNVINVAKYGDVRYSEYQYGGGVRA
ncbi:DnaJ domain protein [Cordyceps militaris CM01]|uniref:DnaJ domain protein n=1 Tax=Cordyceps militaris (strain CM01) TaxID=983644 RepID=G3JNY1_CORMM|nr:DnaJ domain protein [Cordyceps militaris CM01]EGX89591.1 DnaJ domain protein [Cordyceps militaris CM01]